MNIGLNQFGAIFLYLKASEKKDYQHFYQRMLEFAAQDPDLRAIDLPTLLKKLQEGNLVFITSMIYYKALKAKDCRVTVAEERLFPDTLAIHLQKDSPFTDMFNRV